MHSNIIKTKEFFFYFKISMLNTSALKFVIKKKRKIPLTHKEEPPPPPPALIYSFKCSKQNQ